MSSPFISAWRSLTNAFVNSRYAKHFEAKYPGLWRYLVARCDSSATGFKITFGCLIAVGFLSLFFSITEDVVMLDPLVAFDKKVAAIAYGVRNPTLNAAMLAFTDLGAWPTVLAGMVLVSTWVTLRGRAILAASLCISVCAGEMLVWALKGLLLRPRPSVDHALVTTSGASFPSGHAFVAFAFYGYLALLAFHLVAGKMRAVLGTGFLIMVIAIGLSRVYLGVHWLSDVIASDFLGIAWLATFFSILPFVERGDVGQGQVSGDRHPSTSLATMLVLIWFAVYLACYISDLRGIAAST